MKNVGDMARRFLSQYQHGQEQQPKGELAGHAPQPQHPGEEEEAVPPQRGAYTGQGQPQNPEGSAVIPSPAPESKHRPRATRGVVPPNPSYTPPQGDRPQGDAPQSSLPGGPQPQRPYPPQGYSPQQQGGGGFLGDMGGGLLSGLAGGLAGSMIGNAIFGDHGQAEPTQPRQESSNVNEEASQGVQDPTAGFDPNAGGWDSVGGWWEDPGAGWGDGGDDGGWV